LTRQDEKDAPVTDATGHLSNIGRMVEDMEIKLRLTLEQIYFGKTRDIVNDLRSVISATVVSQRKAISQQIGTAISKNN